MPKAETFDRIEVLNKVTDLFWNKGYSATSMQDIVDVSGLNRSSLYNSFGDKYQLFLAALKHYKGSQQKDYINCLLNNTPMQALRSFFTNTGNSIQNREDFKGCLFVNSTAELANRDNKVSAFLQSNMEDMIQLFSDILQRGIEQGEFREDLDVHATAVYLFSSLQGIQLTGMLNQSRKQMDQLIERILSVL